MRLVVKNVRTEVVGCLITHEKLAPGFTNMALYIFEQA